MKFIGRFVFGLLVVLAGMNIFMFSYVDMTMSYLQKYGNLAVEENRSDAFFNSTYIYYQENLLIDETITGDYDFRVVAFVGSNSQENQLQVRIENKDGLEMPKDYTIRLFLEGDAELEIPFYEQDIPFYDTASKLWKASYIDMKAILKDQKDYRDIIDLQIIKFEKVTVDGETETLETILYDFDGTVLVESEDMDIIGLSEVNTVDMMRLKGYRRGSVHDFFQEFQMILWRNMIIFMVIVGFITYLLFFRKRKSKAQGFIPVSNQPTKENLNVKAIEEVKAVDEDQNRVSKK